MSMIKKWEKLFLSKNQNNKLKILLMLIEKSRINMAMLEDTLEITTRIGRNLLEELRVEIANVNNDPLFQLINEDKVYYLGPEFDSKKYTYLYNSIKKRYFNSSASYVVLLFFLEKRKSSIAEVAMELMYSQSYSYKLIDLVNDIFVEAGLTIQLEKYDSGVELVGEEIEIRLFHYCSVIYIYNNLEWPFNYFSRNKVERIQNYVNYHNTKMLSENNQLKRSIIDTIYLQSIHNGKKITAFEKDSVEIYELFEQSFNSVTLSQYIQHNSSLSAAEAKSEIRHLYFFINYVIPEFLSAEEKQKIGSHLFTMEENNIVKLSLATLKLIPEECFFDESTKFIFMYELTTRFIIFKDFKLWQFNQETIKSEFFLKMQKDVYRQVTGIYVDELEGEALHYFVRQIIEIFSPYLLFTYDKSIKVYTEFYHKAPYKLILDNSISFTYNKKSLALVKTVAEADIVISDVYPVGETSSKEYFYFSDIYIKQNWEELNRFLQKKILERGFE